MNLLQELIRIPSQSGSEAGIIDYIAVLLESHEITTYRQDGNVIAFIKGENRQKSLLFNGHVDTVSEGDINSWTYQPFEGKMVGRRIYGLGSSDMKAGVAAMIELALKFKKTTPKCDIWFSFVVGEEVDGRGTVSFLNWFFAERHNSTYERIEAIIAEPTDNKFVGIGHRGNAFVELTISGDGGHASAKSKMTDLAIPAASKLVSQIQSLEKTWQQKYSHDHLGKPTVGITSLKAGSIKAPNQIPTSCSVILDIRTTPLMHERIEKEMKEFVQKQSCKVACHFLSVSPAGWCPESALLRSVFTANWSDFKQLTMTGSADQCFYSQRGIPALIFGPGQRSRMHSTDEYFDTGIMSPYLKILNKVVNEYGDLD